MKKLLMLLMASMVAVAMVGCNPGEEEADVNVVEPAEEGDTTVVQPEPAEPDTTIVEPGGDTNINVEPGEGAEGEAGEAGEGATTVGTTGE